MKKIIIIPYFGDFHPLFSLYSKGIKFNTSFDFYLITDQIISINYKNLFVEKTSFKNLQKKIKKTLGVYPKTPYKLCDYKPLYGEIFKEHLSDYDYWGYSDIDMVLGDLSIYNNIIESNLYDKILDRGHLSFFKNIKSVNNFFNINNSVYSQYKYLLGSKRIWVTDETYGKIIYGVNRLINKAYTKRTLFFDASPYYNEFTDLNNASSEIGFFDYRGDKLFFCTFKNNLEQQKEYLYSHFIKREVQFFEYEKGYIIIPKNWPKVKDISKYFEIAKNSSLTKNQKYLNYKRKTKLNNAFILIFDCINSFEAMKITFKIVVYKIFNLKNKWFCL